MKKPDAGERPLIQAAQKDPARFADLYDRHFERVYAYVARRVRDRTVAEDLTADVFHKALANLGRFGWRGAPFASWLLRIAANAVADHWKRATRDRQIPHSGDPGEVPADDLERRAELFALVDALPRDQRRVIAMRFAQEKTIREIAQELGRTEGAVKQLQFRGLENLRARMGKSDA